MSERKKNVFWAVLGTITLVFVIYFLSRNSNLIETILIGSGALAPIVAVILYPLLAITPITTDPITIVVGVVYGPLVGVAIAWLGNTLAALLEYYFGTRIEKVTNFEKSKEKLPFGLAKLPVKSVAFLILGRMIPGYGSKIISILAGIYKVPMGRYLWTTAATNLFGSILLSYGGFEFFKLLKTV